VNDRGRLNRAYRENRVLVSLCAVIFLTQLGFGGIVPVVPLYAREFGVSQSAIGLTIAVYGLARFLVSMPTGWLADRLGRRWTLVLGEVATAAGNLLCGLSATYEQFLVFRFLAGAGSAMVLTSGQISLADTATPANRGRVMGIYQGVFLFAVGFGPLPGGLLAERFGLSAPFFVFAVLGVLAAIVAFTQVPETRGRRETREKIESGAGGNQRTLPVLQQLRTLFSRIGFVLISLVSFAQFFSRTGAIFTVVPVLGAVKLGLGPDQIGTGLTLVSLLNLGMVYFTGVLADRFGRKTIIVPSNLLTVISMVALALAPTYGWFVAGLALWGIAGGVAGAVPAAYAADMAPPGMNALTMSTFRMVSEFGYVIGPLLLGWISDLSGGEAALFTTAGIFAVTSALFALFAPETRKRRRGPP
jgi:DHA1 family multidrug resistance protein-like MFS transporter